MHVDRNEQSNLTGQYLAINFDLLAYWRSGAGADAQHRAAGLAHNLIGVRKRRACIEGTMGVETEDDQLFFIRDAKSRTAGAGSPGTR